MKPDCSTRSWGRAWAAPLTSAWVCSLFHAGMSCAQARISVSPRDVTLLLEKSLSDGMNIWEINYIVQKSENAGI